MRQNPVRRQRIQFRVDVDEQEQVHQYYRSSRYRGSKSAYLRDLALGNIQHPKHTEETPVYVLDGEDISLGYVEGPEEQLHHYLAVVVAMKMMEIKLNPEYHKLIKQQPDMFQQLVDEIRGYRFDDKTNETLALRRRQGV